MQEELARLSEDRDGSLANFALEELASLPPPTLQSSREISSTSSTATSSIQVSQSPTSLPFLEKASFILHHPFLSDTFASLYYDT